MKFFLNSILLCLINLKFILNEQQTKEIPLSPLEDLPGLKINSIKEIETLSNKSDMTFFLVMYRTDSDNSKRSVTLIKEVYNRLDNLVEFYVYDCTENLEKQSLCEKPAGTDAFPKMVVFVPPEFRVNPYTKQPNHHSQIVFTERQVNVLTIYNFITNNIVSHAKNLNSDNIEEFLK